MNKTTKIYIPENPGPFQAMDVPPADTSERECWAKGYYPFRHEFVIPVEWVQLRDESTSPEREVRRVTKLLCDCGQETQR